MVFTAILYVAMSMYVEKEFLKIKGSLQTFKAGLSKMGGSRKPTDGFDWFQLIDAGKLIVEMKKEGLSMKDIIGELASFNEPAEET